MFALGCGITVLVLGAALVATVGYVGFVTVPLIVDDMVLDEVLLRNGTVQLERFKEVPFPLKFTIRIFNVLNPEEVLNNSVPIVEEVGPYVYRLYVRRNTTAEDDETISYRIVENFEFDSEASFPNTEYDMVTVINMPYHAILQVAEAQSSPMNTLNVASGSIFGAHDSPMMTVSVRDLLFDGVPICQNPSGLVALVACIGIRVSAQDNPNMRLDETNTLWFSFLNYKDGTAGAEYKVDRGLMDHENLGRIITWDGKEHLDFWSNENLANDTQSTSVCNMLNGTDAAIYQPLIATDTILYGFNQDICRSVELRYERDVEYKGVHAYRYAANEWFLDDDDGCFCLNETVGLVRPNGCLHRGAVELYSCTGSFTVLTYPHFLFADFEYANGVVGVAPELENHRIFVDLEPNTGYPLRGAKRAQFNIFTRPIAGITATQNLRTTLSPVLWIEESVELPDDLVDEIKTRLLWPLWLIDVLRPTFLAFAAFLVLVGIILIIVGVRSRRLANTTPTTAPNNNDVNK